MITALVSPAAPAVAGFTVAAGWAVALVVGRARGPVIAPPVLAYAWASSDLSRSVAFQGPLIRAFALLTGSTTIVSTVVSLSLVASGHSSPLAALVFSVAGTCVGLIASTAWLIGQALPRVAAALAPVLVTLGVSLAAHPASRITTPWGWVGELLPVGPPVNAFGSFLPLLAVTLGVVAAVPMIVSRLTLAALLAQSLRWETATAHVTTMELASAVQSYQPLPSRGRHIRAAPMRVPRPLIFLIRDAVGAARTPLRLIIATLALGVTNAIVSFVLIADAPAGLLGAIAGLLLYAAVGPLTDGTRHAVSVASGLPLYGLSDERLLTYHAIFPVVTTTVVVSVGTLLAEHLGGATITTTLPPMLLLSLSAVAARTSTALKGPLPPALLTPIPTAMGDLGPMARVAWATDGVARTAIAGAVALAFPPSPLFAAPVAILLVAAIIRRWHRRR